jgi:Holliday junction resolvase RusA-like endonuclease
VKEPVLLTVHIPGEPVAKGRPRLTKGGTAYTPNRTRKGEAWVKACMIQQAGQPMLEGPLDIDVLVTLEIPISWPRKKREAAAVGILRPTKRPDLDNYCKLICDAGNGLLWRDDSQICGATLVKYYGPKPGVLLTVRGEGLA